MKSDPQQAIDEEVASEICSLSVELNREIAVIINRRGQVVSVYVGDADSIRFSEFKNIREGETRLSGLRCIHTHPNGSSELSKADTSALTSIKFDFIASLGACNSRNPYLQLGFIHANGKTDCEIIGPIRLNELDNIDIPEKVLEIEKQLASKAAQREIPTTEKAVLVSLHTSDKSEFWVTDSLNELEQLALTAGAEVVQKVIQKRPTPDPATFIGSGKAEEIAILIQETGANLVVVDSELSSSQLRNLEAALHVKTIDRTELILDIFAQRAQTREGKLQVELAQLKYMLPKLMGKGLSMSRQGGGGTGGGIATRGPGETKLEVDRRRIRGRIHKLETEVDKIKHHREHTRRQRSKTGTISLAIVGYTNAGKSTLLNVLSGSDVLAENKLFATLDPTTRKVHLPAGENVVVTDTVGFIQNLPTDLIAAFRATLEEVTQADLILHVIDPNHPAYKEHSDTVYDILLELDANEKPVITVVNKIDLVKSEDLLETIKKDCPNPVFVSALNKKGIFELLEKIQEESAKLKKY